MLGYQCVVGNADACVPIDVSVLAGHQGVDEDPECLLELMHAHFVGRCLHCLLRPFGATVQATKPNEILHWDFLFMDGGYILVAKDDFSQFSGSGQPTLRTRKLCDQASQFKNEVIVELQHVLRAHHHFTKARCPWANGTVESAMKTTLKTFRALLLEWLMRLDQWRLIVLVVMLILNHSPPDTIGGVAPITAMTGIRAMSPLDLICVDGPIQSTTLEDLWSVRHDEVKAMAKALDIMHEQVASKSAKKRDRRATNVTWRGPAQVVRVISDWIYEIQNLITGVAREAHSSRLKFYADDSLDVSEDLLRHVAYNADGHVVDDFLGCRWRGLQIIENSWEPATNLLEDLPLAFKKYARANAQDATVVAMAKALGVLQSLGGIVANLPFAEPLGSHQEAAQGFSSLGWVKPQ
ncbi:hypothetical protein H310_13019 [Aphanomyces invadans]|uniref:Integrase catalytic domain-containing protein n=1 Tax=Aphanomyces invadans TaxID=157072 RepID=A0A024TGU8_9STRA|nr:hypothetical protein H310_13019 [Aphanomyces invadans]ETV92806.1 hypothetical protein H310_13019 [Aphanomyces invadans]|eukprot:XP_008878576.1 hypothetical protein H310_13019 [Aphanomyces invadans]